MSGNKGSTGSTRRKLKTQMQPESKNKADGLNESTSDKPKSGGQIQTDLQSGENAIRLPEESPGKKRKLSHDRTTGHTSYVEGDVKQCERCNEKDEEIARLREELSRISIEDFDKIKLKYEEEKRLKEEALTRLSAIASSRLRDNNPNIADLSDQNRPTKIGEKFSELYDNQWTDAFDALKDDMDEREIIDVLLDILMKSYQHCKAIAIDNYFEKVQRYIELPLQDKILPSAELVLPDPLKQQIKEFRKSRAVHVIKDVENAVKDKLESSHEHLEEVKKYISLCVEVSWLMVVQDPPLVLSTETPPAFNTNMYREYTKRGRYIEYVVWPALLLCEGGTLLSKGVAQGSSRKP